MSSGLVTEFHLFKHATSLDSNSNDMHSVSHHMVPNKKVLCNETKLWCTNVSFGKHEDIELKITISWSYGLCLVS